MEIDGHDAFGEVLDRLESKIKEAFKWRTKADELDRDLAVTKQELETAREEIKRLLSTAHPPVPEKPSQDIPF